MAPSLGRVTVLRYALLRTMVLFGCLLALYLVGVRNPVELIALTGVTSIALSYVLLRGPREAMARTVAERAARRLRDPGDPRGQDELAEDRDDDARRAPTGVEPADDADEGPRAG